MAFEPEDIGYDSNGDFATDSVTGDFKLENSNQQHVEDILRSNKGHWYQWPLIGAGLVDRLNSPTTRDEIKQDVKLSLQADDYRVNRIQVEQDGSISVAAERLK